MKCENTFLSRPDYMSSSASIFDQNSICIQDYNPCSIESQFDSQQVPQKRDEKHYICIGYNAKKLLKNTSVDTFEHLIQMSKDKLKHYEGKEIILSMGCGNGATELLSDKLCVCLDVDKRSVFTGMIQLHKSVNVHSNKVVFGIFDYSNRLFEFCSALKGILNKDQVVRVLFQHPTPSYNEAIRNKLCSALTQVRSAMMNKLVCELVIVYDLDEKRNTWRHEKILEIFFNAIDNYEKARFTNSKYAIISNDDDTVTHPIFGNVKRFGWGKMRNSEQSSLIITYN